MEILIKLAEPHLEHSNCFHQLQDYSSVLSSTQLFQRRRLFPEEPSETDRSDTSHQRADRETVRRTASASVVTSTQTRHGLVHARLFRSHPTPPTWAVEFVVLRFKWLKLTPVTLCTLQFGLQWVSCLWLLILFNTRQITGLCVCDWKNKAPRRTVTNRQGRLHWSFEDLNSLAGDTNQSTPKKRKLSRSSQEEMSVQIKNESREGLIQTSVW